MTTETEITMINDTDSTSVNTPTSGKRTGIGERFKLAREAMHLSQKEVGIRLHLSPKLINIMEEEDFENSLPHTFLRGYIRSYGKLLNIQPTELDHAIESLKLNTPPTKTLKLATAPLTDDNERYLHWASYVIIFILVALVGIWWSTTPTKTQENLPVKKTVAPPVVTQAPVTEPKPSTITSIPNTPQHTPITAQPPINSAVKSAPEVASPVPPPDVVEPAALAPQNTAETPKENMSSTSTLKKIPAATEVADLHMSLPEPDLDTNDY